MSKRVDYLLILDKTIASLQDEWNKVAKGLTKKEEIELKKVYSANQPLKKL